MNLWTYDGYRDTKHYIIDNWNIIESGVKHHQTNKQTKGSMVLSSYFYYTPRNEVVGGYTDFTMSVHPSVCRQILCRTITWVVFIKSNNSGTAKVKIVKNERDPPLFTGKLLIKFQNILRNTTQVIIWHRVKILFVVFLRMFWNFISSLPVKRGGSLSFLTIFTFAIPELLDLIWRKIGFFVPTKNESNPPLFTGKLLIKFQNILRNNTQVIIRHRVKILFSRELIWNEWFIFIFIDIYNN
jgi:hypothetical protein